ncbi:MAG: hypothetical protein EOP04_12050 [Proteobacteria bacterium]|nr:MAG: hypothetical protein EOP04_12050 [Pseudomonadota bacterium]
MLAWIIPGFGCRLHRSPENSIPIREQKINLLHRGDPNLAGVIIYQNDPVNMDGAMPRKSTDHPFVIMYYFWDGRVRDVAYDKEGEVVRDIWRTRFTPITKREWSRVNFSLGSDPMFQRHADPRK